MQPTGRFALCLALAMAPFGLAHAQVGGAPGTADSGTAAQPTATPQQQQGSTAPPQPKLTERVTVTADRGLVGVNDEATSVAVVSGEQISAHPGFSLDDALRTVAGFQLFRRTSSWTANPTSQGVSLRGLGSTAASRTLVVSDQVPLNDPFGGWIHWNELPLLAIDHAELLRGGASDLYGSSAIGGAINLVPLAPQKGTLHVAADASGASEDTAQVDALLTAATARDTGVLAAGSLLRSHGYIPTAPASRGAADAPSNVTGEAARLQLNARGYFLRGNLLNETRGNGTLLQNNGTRIWRYSAGGDHDFAAATHAAVRLFGSRETYHQSFSSLSADRNTEHLTRLQSVPTDELGVVLQGAHSFGSQFTGALGFDVRDIRATDNETPVSNNALGTTASTSARQRATGGYADGVWQPARWSLSGSVRVDSFRTFDAATSTSNGRLAVAQPALSELMASPHVGVVVHLPRSVALTASAFRAFRGPTLNELYRTGQVGQQTTLANNSLLAERATGFESGVLWQPAALATVRATGFWTEVNRPVSAVLLAQTATSQTLQRQNLGQIRSRGLMLESELNPWHGFSAAFSYQYAVATVTSFSTVSPLQRNLLGNWIPQVPRQSMATRVVWQRKRIMRVELDAITSGHQFDDAENLYLLHAFTRFDAFAERSLGHRLSVFAASQNLLDRAIEAGRTPLLTLASPRTVQAGLRFSFDR